MRRLLLASLAVLATLPALASERWETLPPTAANTVPSGVKDGVEKNQTFAAYIERAGREYVERSATPKDYNAFVEQISRMWAEQPNWSDAQLKTIDTPILVVMAIMTRVSSSNTPNTSRQQSRTQGSADPAKCEPFRLSAGPPAIQFRLHFLGDE